METTCVYQHRRLDTNEVFYVGIGNKERPYYKHRRSKYWNNIINKTNYIIEIIHENLSWELACEIEMFLINYYGKKNNNGSLCNITDGGDGVKGLKMSTETKNKIGKSKIGNTYNLGRKFTEEHKKKLSLIKINKKATLEIKQKMQESRSKIILNLETGVFYYGFREASSIHNIKEKTLWNQLTGKSRNNTNLILTENG